MTSMFSDPGVLFVPEPQSPQPRRTSGPVDAPPIGVALDKQAETPKKRRKGSPKTTSR